jgi:hypothetical protein
MGGQAGPMQVFLLNRFAMMFRQLKIYPRHENHGIQAELNFPSEHAPTFRIQGDNATSEDTLIPN